MSYDVHVGFLHRVHLRHLAQYRYSQASDPSMISGNVSMVEPDADSVDGLYDIRSLGNDELNILVLAEISFQCLVQQILQTVVHLVGIMDFVRRPSMVPHTAQDLQLASRVFSQQFYT